MKKFVTVRIGHDYFGITIACIRSIEKMVEMINIPTSFNWLTGVINLREGILPVIDIKQILFGKITEINASTRLVIAETNNRLVALIVDEALDIFEVLEDEIKEIAFDFGELSFLEGIAKKDEQLFTILNTNKLFESLKEITLDEIQEIIQNDNRYKSLSFSK